MSLACLGTIGGVLHGPLLNLSDTGGDADDDAWMHENLSTVGLLNEIRQHLLGHSEVCNNSIFHRADGDDVTGRSAEHVLRFFTDGFRLIGELVDSNDG